MKNAPKRFTNERLKIAKRYCWNMYSHKPWFCGAKYRRDPENPKVPIGIDILVDPEFTDRFTYVTAYASVPIRVVNWSQEEHGDRYDPEKGM